jgi:hypothetical protein
VAPEAPAEEPAVEVEQDSPTYETRDMVPEEEISPRTGRPKRAYTRRDMKADA